MVTGNALGLLMVSTTSPLPPGYSRLAADGEATALMVRLATLPDWASPEEPEFSPTTQFDAAKAAAPAKAAPVMAEMTLVRFDHRAGRGSACCGLRTKRMASLPVCFRDTPHHGAACVLSSLVVSWVFSPFLRFHGAKGGYERSCYVQGLSSHSATYGRGPGPLGITHSIVPAKVSNALLSAGTRTPRLGLLAEPGQAVSPCTRCSTSTGTIAPPAP